MLTLRNITLALALAPSVAFAAPDVDALIAAARSERDPLRYQSAVSRLLREKQPLTRPQKRAILGMVRDSSRGLLPKSTPVPAQGPIEIRHYAMSDFLDADIRAYERAGFRLTRTPGGAEGTLGRLRVKMQGTHENMLRDLGDDNVNVIVYSGHSQIGGTVEQALLQPGLKAPNKRKLVAMFQCVGEQTAPMLKAHAPLADVMTSTDPLYVAETPNMIEALLRGLNEGDNYPRLQRRFEKAAWTPKRMLYPSKTRSLRAFDLNRDGVLDDHQAFGAPETTDPSARVAAKNVMSGVHFLRTLNPYYAEQTTGAVFGRDISKVPLISKGIVDDNGQSVTQIIEKNEGGRRSFEVGLNRKFANEAPHFIGAATVFETQMHLQRSLLGKSGPREKVRALAFAGEYLELVGRNHQEADQALRKLAQQHGLPSVSLSQVEGALYGTHILGEEQVTRLENLLNNHR